MEMEDKAERRAYAWRCWTVSLGALCVALVIAVIIAAVVATRGESTRAVDTEQIIGSSFPCPAQNGGLMTSGDPDSPSPFHDLTMAEYARLYDFLRKQPKLNLAPPDRAEVNSSSIFIVDLLTPPKLDVLSFLDNKGQQPPRQARVMLFRGDKTPPLVEE